jgi:hypothetical protein
MVLETEVSPILQFFWRIKNFSPNLFFPKRRNVTNESASWHRLCPRRLWRCLPHLQRKQSKHKGKKNRFWSIFSGSMASLFSNLIRLLLCRRGDGEIEAGGTLGVPCMLGKSGPVGLAVLPCRKRSVGKASWARSACAEGVGERLSCQPCRSWTWISADLFRSVQRHGGFHLLVDAFD